MNCIETLYHSPHVYAGNTWRGAETDVNDTYSGFSICHYVGDSEQHIAECRSSLRYCLGIDENHLIVPRQTHSINIVVIDRIPFEPAELNGVDAVITGLKGVAVGVNTADCVPVILIDENASLIAAVHAGWRGAVADIVPATVERMKALSAKNIKAYIGPCICEKCFEVGDEVAERFPEFVIKRNYGVKPHIDLQGFVMNQIENAGVEYPQKSIPCTRCNPEHYFSARAQGINSGRNFSFAILL